MSIVNDAAKQQERDLKSARITELAAHINAAHAELATLVADFDRQGLWVGGGIRTCHHWLTINTGMSTRSADELLRVGKALGELPRLREAFGSGRLSLDKLRDVTRVATPADEDVWLDIALCASGAQLSRICRGYLESGADDAGAVPERGARRGIWTSWRSDGLLELRALLLPEDGAVVLAAIDAVIADTGAPVDGAGSMDQAPASQPQPARRADALTSLCEAVLRGPAPDAASRGAVYRVVVHIDAPVLAGEASAGRCHVEDGPRLLPSVVRRLGCDADVVAVIERDGSPLDIGRARPVIAPRLRWAVRMRDNGCRFPGCSVPARYTQAHHVRHWSAGGPTVLGNLLSLCGFHHRRHHDGAFDIVVAGDGRPQFWTAATRWSPRGRPFGGTEGQPLVTRSDVRLRRVLIGKARAITPETPVARDRGARFDVGLTTEILHSAAAKGRRLATAGSAAAGAGP